VTVQEQQAQTETQESSCEHQEKVDTARLTKHWHTLPREVVELLFLEIFKSHMDRVLGSLL